MNYSSTDIMNMQQDAIRRVREMQRRARQRVNPHQGNPAPHARNEQPEAPHRPPEQPAETPVSSPLSGLLRLGSLFGGTPIGKAIGALGVDGEQLLLLGLIVLLLNEGADKKLIMALCYLMF